MLLYLIVKLSTIYIRIKENEKQQIKLKDELNTSISINNSVME